MLLSVGLLEWLAVFLLDMRKTRQSKLDSSLVDCCGNFWWATSAGSFQVSRKIQFQQAFYRQRGPLVGLVTLGKSHPLSHPLNFVFQAATFFGSDFADLLAGHANF